VESSAEQPRLRNAPTIGHADWENDMQPRRHFRPRVERLEDRVTPAGNFLITHGFPGDTQTIEEYTPAGALVSTLTPPQTDYARDLVVAPNGDIHLFNGTFSPQLSTYHAGAWTNRTASNWSTVNDLSYGGVATFGDYVYVTDMETGSETPPDNGIVRFNLATGAVERFAAGTDYIKLTLGLDGLLYALGPQNGFGNPIDVYEPVSMSHLATVQSPSPDGRGLAVAANGDIYVADWYNTVYRLDSAGAILNTVSVSDSTSDIDVSTDGSLVVGGRFSVMTMNADLTGVQTFSIAGGHVAFADYQAPAPRPLLGTIEGTPLSYSEGDGATPITSALTVADPNSPTIAGATVWISQDFVAAEDVLSFADQSGISGSYDADTGVLTLTGVASTAAYQAALRSVAYLNNSQNPLPWTRRVSFRFDDGTGTNGQSNTATRDVRVAPVNDAPALTVPASGLTVVQNREVAVGGISVADVDARTGWEQLTLTVAHGTLRFVSLSNLTVVGGANNSATVTVQSSPLANLNAALAGNNLVYTPRPNYLGADTLSLTVDDLGNTGSGGALTDHETVLITVVIRTPVLANVESSPVAFTEGDAARAVTNNLTVAAPDSPTIAGAAVWVGRNFVRGEDVLAFTNQNGITGSYNPLTGVLRLSGVASVANYQAALRSVAYLNPSQNPSPAPRIISFQVNDGGGANHFSNVQSRAVSVSAVNDAPALAAPAAAVRVSQGHDIVLSGVGAGDVDAGAGKETLTLAVSSGTIRFLSLAGVTVVAGANNSVSVAVRGTIPQLKKALAGGNLVYRSNAPFTGTDTLTLTLDDGGNTGAGGALVANATVSIVVSHVSPALGAADLTPLPYAEGGPAKAIVSTLGLTAPYSPTIAGATVWISGNFAGAEDVLGFADQSGITGSYDAATGVLTLTGAASAAAYRAALRSVVYVNTSHDPSAAPRTISFQVNDGAAANGLSNVLSRVVRVTAINDAPVLTVPVGGLSGARGADIAVLGVSVADLDARGGEEKLTLAVSSGTLRFLSLEGVTVVAGANNSSSITVRGPLARLNALLAGGSVVYRPNPGFGGADLLTLTIDDGGNTGAGGAKIDRKWVSITVA
jgi:hypothetical protein